MSSVLTQGINPYIVDTELARQQYSLLERLGQMQPANTFRLESRHCVSRGLDDRGRAPAVA